MPSDTRSIMQPGSIIIARHGQPEANREAILTWRQYEDWWDHEYQPARLVPGQVPPPELVRYASEASTLFASTLRRAVETAETIAPGRDLIFDPCFVEAELPPPPMPGKYMAKHWGVFARCSWWMGLSRGRESRVDAEMRADAATEKLIAAAAAGPVVLCAHGWFNRMIRPSLRGRNWYCVEDRGDMYWSWRRYEFRPV
ncbi:histidine phosphatase family protein [Maricaulis sp. CAU 1757]